MRFRKNLMRIVFISFFGGMISLIVEAILNNFNKFTAVDIGSLTITLISVAVSQLVGDYKMKPPFEEKYQLLQFLNLIQRENYEKILVKYYRLYRKMNDPDEMDELLEKLDLLLQPVIMEAQKNKEEKEKIKVQKKNKRKKMRLETLEQWYQEDKMALHPFSKSDQ